MNGLDYSPPYEGSSRWLAGKRRTKNGMEGGQGESNCKETGQIVVNVRLEGSVPSGRVTVQFAVLPKHQCTQYLGSIGGLKSGNFTSEKIERRVIFVKKKYEFLSDSSCISFRKISAEQEK